MLKRSDDSKMQIIVDVILTELCLVSDMLQKSFKKPSALTLLLYLLCCCSLPLLFKSGRNGNVIDVIVKSSISIFISTFRKINKGYWARS